MTALQSRDGTCVTSCSATQLPDSSLLVFPAAVLFHLLTLSARQLLADTRLSRDGDRPAVSNSASATPLEFLPGVRISVTVGRACEQTAVSVFDLSPSRVQLVSVPSVQETLQQVRRIGLARTSGGCRTTRCAAYFCLCVPLPYDPFDGPGSGGYQANPADCKLAASARRRAVATWVAGGPYDH